MKYSFDEKLDVVKSIISGKSQLSVCRERHIDQHTVYIWLCRYRRHGESGLLKSKRVNHYSPSEKERIILEHVQEGVSLSQLSLRYDLDRSTIKAWLREVRSGGSPYDVKRPADPAREPMARPKKKDPQTDLEKLQAENLRLRAEIALLKKVKALVEEQEARALRSGQKPSTN